MKKWLKRHFIPREENGYRPEFLSARNMRHIAGVALFFELILFVLPFLNTTTYFSNLDLSAVLPGVLSTITNEEREKMALPELVENPVLDKVAQMKAEDMASKGYFAHTSPEGKSPWYWFDKVGYKYLYAGENLAVNFSDSREVARAWMNSPSHKENIVNAGYTEVGTGIASGVYEGRETIFVVQVYGSPSARNVVAKASSDFFALNPLSGGSDTTQKSQLAPAPQSLAKTSEVTTEVLGASEVSVAKVNVTERLMKSPSFWQKALTSPSQTTRAVFYTILSILFIALFFNIVIHFERQYPDLITNGLVVAALILAFNIGNDIIAKSRLETSFVAFNNTTVSSVPTE